MAVVATRHATSRRIRDVHVPRATAAISSRRRHPWLSPTPSLYAHASVIDHSDHFANLIDYIADLYTNTYRTNYT
jgi:hypothetical protein